MSSMPGAPSEGLESSPRTEEHMGRALLGDRVCAEGAPEGAPGLSRTGHPLSGQAQGVLSLPRTEMRQGMEDATLNAAQRKFPALHIPAHPT